METLEKIMASPITTIFLVMIMLIILVTGATI